MIRESLMFFAMGCWRLLSCLPRAWQWRMAGSIGRFCGWIVPKRRHIMRCNLAWCFSSLSATEQKILLDKNQYYLGLSFCDIAVAWFWTDVSIRGQIPYRWVGLDDFLQVQKSSSRGILLMSKHMQHLELSGRLLGMYVNYHIVYRRHASPLLQAHIMRARQAMALDISDRGRPRQFLRWLRSGATVLYYPDQDYGTHRAIRTELLGVPAMMTTAPYALHTRSGCLLYFFDSVYVDGVLELSLKPLSLPVSDATVFTIALADYIAQSIARAPEQYFWAHRRFKSTKGKQAYA